jgi:outer membrane receptor protein involved in Fe transport
MASVAFSGASIGAAFAQDATEAVDEKVVITGSRIARRGLISPSPVTTVGQAEAQKQGTISVEELLNNQPAVTSGWVSEVSNGATGTATVDLRSLGPQRTLVLINGRRMGIGDPLLPVADLNAIPIALVDRVEVVTGGASAVYGSDALAGAVNFIMKKNFEGVQLDLQYGFFEHNNDNAAARARIAARNDPVQFPLPNEHVIDGESFVSTITMGANTADGKGNVTVYASYRNQQPLLQSERDISACALTDGVALSCAGSINYAIVIPDFGNGNLYGIQNTDGTLAPFQRYNFAPTNYLQTPKDDYQFGAFAHYEVSKNLDIYTDLMFSDTQTDAQIAPSGMFLDRFWFTNCDNPLLSPDQVQAFCTDFGLAGGEQAGFLGARRSVEGGGRDNELRHTNYRMVVGARGEITPGWDYDIYGQHNSSPYQNIYLNDWSASRVFKALLVNPATGNCFAFDDGTDLNCVPLNIWGGIGAITQDQLDYIEGTGIISGSTYEDVVSGSITGDLGTLGLTLPGSDRGVQIAVGAEYRLQQLKFTASQEFVSGDLTGQGGTTPSQPLRGFDVWEAFVELDVPIVTDKPFFKLLAVNGGFRKSDYSSAGVTDSYKYGAEWAPSSDIRFRGSFQHATRAPNVIELFSPNSSGLFVGSDPCAGAVPAATLLQCQNMGMAGGDFGSTLACPSGQCQSFFGGNPNLKPETSDSVTYGVVLTPGFLKGFSFSADYYDIEVNDRIGVLGGTTILQQCLIDNSALSPFCQRVIRGPNGELFLQGISGVIDTNVNAGVLKTRGVDFEANYVLDLDTAGSLALNFVGTLSLENTIANLGAAAFDCTDFFGATCGTPYFDWKHKARATWSSPWDVDLSIAWRRVSEVFFDANTTNPSFNGVCGGPCGFSVNGAPAFNYFDVSGSWAINETYEVRFGVNNVLDKDPPVFDGSGFNAFSATVSGPPFGNANTFPGAYDSLGRQVFISGSIKL